MFDDIEGLTPELKAKLEEQVKSQFVPKTEFEAVNSKKEELLGEAKKAKEAARLAAEQAAEAERQKALKNGDVESLQKSFAEKERVLQERLSTIERSWNAEKIAGLANQFVSSKFVSDPVISEAIVAKFSQRLDIREGKVVVLDPEGNLTSLSIEDLKNEFLKNSVFKPHIISTNASGGGASGGSGNGTGGAKLTLAKAKTIAERTEAIRQKMNS